MHLKLLIVALCLLLFSCNSKHDAVLHGVFENYDDFKHKKKYFDDFLVQDILLIIYRAEMSKEMYSTITSNPELIEACDLVKNSIYWSMNENRWIYDINYIDWWFPIYFGDPDFVGFYDLELQKYSSCKESIAYKYAFAYKEGYCYLIIESTGREPLDFLPDNE